MGEKCRSTPRVTIHQCPEICHLGMHFVHKWVRKRPYTLCKSCRGILDLQLSNLHLGALQFNFLELHSVKQGYLKNFRRHWALLNAPAAPTPRAARAVVPLGPDAEARLPRGEPGAAFHTTSRPRSSLHRLPDPFPLRQAPSRADPGCRPMASPPYILHSATALPCPYRGRV
jgi:hypothetical protein